MSKDLAMTRLLTGAIAPCDARGNTPPKHHNDMKKGKRKIRGDDAPRPIPSDDGKRD